MKGNPRLGKLRWIMIATMCADTGFTLLGQPASYWRKPTYPNEANLLFAAVMRHGWIVYVLTAIACGAALFFLTRILPERLSLIIILVTTLSSYFGASTWVVYHYHFESTGEIMLAIPLSIALMRAWPKDKYR